MKKLDWLIAILGLTLVLLTAGGTGWLVITALQGSFERSFLKTVGIIAPVIMALLQIIKRLLPARKWFHMRVLKHWLGRGLAGKHGAPHNMLVEIARQELLRLAVTSERRVLLDLPIEQLCGQITVASESLLDYPRVSPESFSRSAPDLSRQAIRHRRARRLLVRALAGHATKHRSLQRGS